MLHKFRKQHQLKFKTVRRIFFMSIFFLALFSYFTNPFTRLTVIKDPFRIELVDGNMYVFDTRQLRLYDNIIAAFFGKSKSGWHIFTNKIQFRKPTGEKTLDEIIDTIHKKRFSSELPYLISGEHFSVLYPRSLGVFYHSLLDPRTARGDRDWKNRQEIYLKTTAFALASFQHANRLTTTIVPVEPTAITLVNFFSPPSDTLYSLLYAIQRLESPSELEKTYPFGADVSNSYSLQTASASASLLSAHRSSLLRHFRDYYDDVYDQHTGLVHADVVLSGTKDSVIRRESFYDNVVFWKTATLAQSYGLMPTDPEFLASLKDRIIRAFWIEDAGYFNESLEHITPSYSSDWLIAVMTGFLDLSNTQDAYYASRSVDYIRAHRLDQPFGLKYQNSNQRNALHLPVRIFAPTYSNSAIWSHWGIEYIKLLSTLYQKTCQSEYLELATSQLNSYTNNILIYQGFPEVYSEDGKLYTHRGYRGIREAGWIVNYEQAKAQLEWSSSEHICNNEYPAFTR